VWCVEPAMVITAPSFMVFFDFDKSTLTPAAIDTIAKAAAAYRAKGGAQIKASGHTDRAGTDAYNMALSLRRANVVKDALVQQGVPAGAINAVGVGKAGLLVQTGDGVREPQNRRVEMVIGGGMAGMSDAQYCAMLAPKVRDISRGTDPTGELGRALSNCQTGTGDYGIPFMVKYLTDNKVPVPPRA
jgi:OmpA family